jgi:hypothetical protein
MSVIFHKYIYKEEHMLLYELFKKNLAEYDDLATEKQNIIAAVSGLSAENEQDAALLDRIYKLLNTGTIGTNIEKSLIPPSSDESMSQGELVKHRQEVTKIISNLDSNYASLNAFLKKMESGGVVNISELSKPINSLSAVFNNDPLAVKAFIALARYGVGVKQKGPGEFALALLSNKIKLASGEGDLEIEGIGKVELKAAMSTSGGRIGYGGGSQKAKRDVLEKYAEYIPTIIASIGAKGGSLALNPFVQALNTDLPISGENSQENRKMRKDLMLDLLTMDMDQYAGKIADTISSSEDSVAIEKAYLEQNYNWYKNRDNFDALLLISILNQKTSMIKDVGSLLSFRFQSGNSSGTSIGIIPTQAGAGREQWAQLTLNKAKI